MYFILTREDGYMMNKYTRYHCDFYDPVKYNLCVNNYSKINNSYKLEFLHNNNQTDLVYSGTMPKYIRCVLFNTNTNCDGSNKMILSDRYYLLDSKTIKKFNLSIDEYFIAIACFYGDINFLEWLKKSGLFQKIFSKLSLKSKYVLLNYSSSNGHTHVLEWWKNSGFPLKYDEWALGYASSNGHVDVLEWWKNSGLELKYDTYALVWASKCGHVNVIRWFMNNNFKVSSWYRIHVYYDTIKSSIKHFIGL
jgi:hypothetical protein